MTDRDILIKNITIIESFNKWLIEKSIYDDYDYYDENNDPENEELTDRIERILHHMENALSYYNNELLEKYKNKLQGVK